MPKRTFIDKCDCGRNKMACYPVCGRCRAKQYKRVIVPTCRQCGRHIHASSVAKGGICAACRREHYVGQNAPAPPWIEERIELYADRASRGEPIFGVGYRERAVEQGWVEC